MDIAQLWPWLAMAGLGALHGLNPTSGWMLAAAWGLRTADRRQALAALVPIGLGHLASLGLVALLAAGGLSLNRTWTQVGAGALMAVSLALHLWRRTPRAIRAPAGHAGLALWAFFMSSLQGAGLVLVPVLLPLCTAQTQGGPSGWMLALAGIALHGGAMLLAAGAAALGLCRGIALCSARRRGSTGPVPVGPVGRAGPGAPG